MRPEKKGQNCEQVSRRSQRKNRGKELLVSIKVEMDGKKGKKRKRGY